MDEPAERPRVEEDLSATPIERPVLKRLAVIDHGANRVLTVGLRLSAQGQTHARVDPDRATQVLGNLVSNALRYGSPGTPVEIALRKLDGELEMSVHNQGPRIPSQVLPRLFDAFQRGVPDGSRHGDGLGLGLYIVQQIVEAHDGGVSVRSEEGSGTTFAVRWPKK